MRSLGFEVKKAEVLKILKDYDNQGSGKILFQDYSEVGKFRKMIKMNYTINKKQRNMNKYFQVILNLLQNQFQT